MPKTSEDPEEPGSQCQPFKISQSGMTLCPLAGRCAWTGTAQTHTHTALHVYLKAASLHLSSSPVPNPPGAAHIPLLCLVLRLPRSRAPQLSSGEQSVGGSGDTGEELW